MAEAPRTWFPGTNWKQLSLRQAGEFDRQNNLAARLTGWGAICKARHAAGTSRRARIAQRKGK